MAGKSQNQISDKQQNNFESDSSHQNHSLWTWAHVLLSPIMARSIRKIRKFSRFRWWSCLPVVLCIYVCCVLLLCFYLCIGYWQRRREMCCTRFRWKSIRWLKWIVPNDKLKLNDGNGNNGTSEKLQQRNNQSNSHGFKFASIYFRFDWFRSNRIPDCGARSQEYGESVTRNGGGEKTAINWTATHDNNQNKSNNINKT